MNKRAYIQFKDGTSQILFDVEHVSIEWFDGTQLLVIKYSTDETPKCFVMDRIFIFDF